MTGNFAVGDRVTWVTRVDGIRRRGFGVIDKVEGVYLQYPCRKVKTDRRSWKTDRNRHVL